jgi:hypothetical protein
VSIYVLVFTQVEDISTLHVRPSSTKNNASLPCDRLIGQQKHTHPKLSSHIRRGPIARFRERCNVDVLDIYSIKQSEKDLVRLVNIYRSDG